METICEYLHAYAALLLAALHVHGQMSTLSRKTRYMRKLIKIIIKTLPKAVKLPGAEAMQISENQMMSPFCACVLQQSAATLAGNRGLSEPASTGIEEEKEPRGGSIGGRGIPEPRGA